jgi:uncharacterized LabA/DUF88 family protein
METVLFVDWENFKGKMKAVFANAKLSKPKWYKYNFQGLFTKVLQGIPIHGKVFYFARIKKHEDSKEKSQELIEEQRLLKTHLEQSGFKVVLSGRVRGQYQQDKDGKKVLVFKEKGVDVKIAVDMVSLACDKQVKQMIVASSDSDLQPAIKEVRDRGVDCVYLGFEMQPNKGLSYTTDRTILIRNSEILEFAKPPLYSNKDISIIKRGMKLYSSKHLLKLLEMAEGNATYKTLFEYGKAFLPILKDPKTKRPDLERLEGYLPEVVGYFDTVAELPSLPENLQNLATELAIFADGEAVQTDEYYLNLDFESKIQSAFRKHEHN